MAPAAVPAAAAALAAEEEAAAAMAKARERRARKARAKKLRALEDRGGEGSGGGGGGGGGGRKRKPRSRSEVALQQQVDRMGFLKRATDRDGRPLLENDAMTRKVVGLVEMRDKFQAHLLTLLEAEEAADGAAMAQLLLFCLRGGLE